MGGTVDTAQLLSQILGQNKTDLGELAKKAATPIPGGHTSGIPASMLPNPQPLGPAAMIPHQPGTDVVGKGNARNIGIGNAIIGATHALAATEKAVTDKRKLEIASSTQQLLTAQSGYDQAAQVLKSDPNNADAKAALQRNMNVMNGILSNDKTRKAIAKGMNIDFTDPSANDTIEHQGVAQGKQMAKDHASYGEQFNQKTPTTMQPNQQAQAQYQAALEQQKINTNAVKAIIPLLSAQMKAASEDKRTQGILEASRMKEVGALAVQQSRDQAAWNRTLTNIQARSQLADKEHGFKLGEIAAQGQRDMDVFHSKMEEKANDPMALVKSYNDFQNKSTATVAKMTETIKNLEDEKDKVANDKDKAGVSKDLDDQIHTAQEALNSYKQYMASSTAMYKEYAKIGADNGAAGSNDGTDKLSNADTYLHTGGSDDDTGDEESPQ